MRELKLWKAIDLENLNVKQQAMLERMDDNTKSLLEVVLSIVSPLMRVNEVRTDGTRYGFEYKFSGIISHASEYDIRTDTVIIDNLDLMVRSGSRVLNYSNGSACNVAKDLYADALYTTALNYIEILKNKKERARKEVIAAKLLITDTTPEEYHNAIINFREKTYNEISTFNELSDAQKTVLNEFLTYSAIMLTFTTSRREDVAPLGEGKLYKYIESKDFTKPIADARNLTDYLEKKRFDNLHCAN